MNRKKQSTPPGANRPCSPGRHAASGPRHYCAASPLLVAIVGGSGSGKSWLAEKLQVALGEKAVRLSLDDFYQDRSHLQPDRRAKINFDHPRAIDWPAVERVLAELQAGRAARVVRYDFKTHSRLGPTAVLEPRPIILVDGLWLLRRPALRRLFAWRIFLDCPARVRLSRRLTRDLLARGRTRASVLKQFRATVEPMHRKFVTPQRRWADLVLKQGYALQQVEALAEKLRSLIAPAGAPTRHASGAEVSLRKAAFGASWTPQLSRP